MSPWLGPGLGSEEDPRLGLGHGPGVNAGAGPGATHPGHKKNSCQSTTRSRRIFSLLFRAFLFLDEVAAKTVNVLHRTSFGQNVALPWELFLVAGELQGLEGGNSA